MGRLLLVVVLVLSIPNIVSAGDFICYNTLNNNFVSKVNFEIDSAQIQDKSVCPRVTRSKAIEVENSGLLFKFDDAIPGSNDDKFIPLSQNEIDQINSQKAVAENDFNKIRIESLDISAKELAKALILENIITEIQLISAVKFNEEIVKSGTDIELVSE